MSPPITFHRHYLLSVYNAALEQGHILLRPISAEDAARFTQSFYRLRRRSDKSNASFILPEFHLITVGEWSPEDGGTLPILYNTSPYQLPTILTAAGAEIAEPTAERLSRYLPPAPSDAAPALDGLTPDEIVAHLRKKPAGDDTANS